MAAERKEKTIRVLQLLQTTDKRSPMNATEIVDKLENDYEIGKTERRSIYRDVKMLQSCGYPIKQAKDRKQGWYMERHAFDDWEIKVMMDAVKQARCVSAMEAEKIREKLLKITSNRGRSRFSHMITPLHNNMDMDIALGNYIETMLEAMYTHKKIRFQYTEIDNNLQRVMRREGKVYKLNLYAVYWASNTYYLIGAHDHHEGVTSYRLDRVENLIMTDEPEIPAKEKIGQNPELYIRDYIEKSVNHFSGEKIRIEVEYTPNQITNAILYDFAGKDIKIIESKFDKMIVSFSKMKSETLIGWFTQYSNFYKVVAPESLKQEIVSRLTEAVNWYKE